MKDGASDRPNGSTFDQPVGETIERVAERAAGRTSSQVWAPVVVAVLGLLGMASVLIVVGEVITHADLLAGFRSADDRLSELIADHRTAGWTSFSELWSKSAETVPIVVGALLIELVLAVLRRWRDLLLVVIGLAVELGTFLLVNGVVQRERPDVSKVGIVPTTFSFPSGHTAATIVLYGSIVLLVTLRWRSHVARAGMWAVVLVITAAVGYARVYRGMHHVSDVVAGALMGIGCLFIAVTATRASSIAARKSHASPALAVSQEVAA